ncbi:hypothetical protein QYF36_022118 [Acer negundo]|nr:hypothetical protein QYF36_022118 [Acer negundo]
MSSHSRELVFLILQYLNEEGLKQSARMKRLRSIFPVSLRLKTTVARILNEELSSPVSMDFHPVLHTLLLVGTNTGDIGLWDVFFGVKFLSRNFKVWDMGRCSILSKRDLVKDPLVSVKRVIWSPDGCFFGIANSKHIAQLYSYHGGSDVRTHLEKSRLVYYTAGNAILALGSNGVHLRWKWPKDDDLDQSGQATAKVTTQLWQLKNSLQLLINDVSNNNPEASVSCFALSKNNSYLFSKSGKTITLFNLITYEAMTNFLPPAPMATCIAFYPQNNNIIAIGMDDSIILIYNVPMAQPSSRDTVKESHTLLPECSIDAYPNAIASHPQKPTQFALNLKNLKANGSCCHRMMLACCNHQACLRVLSNHQACLRVLS